MRALLAVMLLLAAGCEDTRRARRDRDDDGVRLDRRGRPAIAPAAKATTAYARCVGDPTCLPDVTFRDTDGVDHTRDDLSGKITIISFWAEWCGPCAEEGPILSRIADAYRRDVVVLGITVDHSTDHEVEVNARRLGITYPVLALGALARDLGEPSNLPTTWIFDRYGTRVETFVGVSTEAELTTLLDRLTVP